MLKQKQWTPEEMTILLELAPKASISEIALCLSRSYGSVHHKIEREKISVKRLVTPHEKRSWTEKEEHLLTLWAGELPISKIAKKLKRSNESILFKARRMGLTLPTELDNWSSLQFSSLTGIPFPTVCYWIRKGWLIAEKLGKNAKCRYMITRKNFTKFYFSYHKTLPSLQKISPEILDWILVKKRG